MFNVGKKKNALDVALLMLVLVFMTLLSGGCGGGGGSSAPAPGPTPTTGPVTQDEINRLSGAWAATKGFGIADDGKITFNLTLRKGTAVFGVLGANTDGTIRGEQFANLTWVTEPINGYITTIQLSDDKTCPVTITKVRDTVYTWRLVHPQYGTDITVTATILADKQIRVEEKGTRVIDGVKYTYSGAYEMVKQ